jgi:hypothetical protein
MKSLPTRDGFTIKGGEYRTQPEPVSTNYRALRTLVQSISISSVETDPNDSISAKIMFREHIDEVSFTTGHSIATFMKRAFRAKRNTDSPDKREVKSVLSKRLDKARFFIPYMNVQMKAEIPINTSFTLVNDMGNLEHIHGTFEYVVHFFTSHF